MPRGSGRRLVPLVASLLVLAVTGAALVSSAPASAASVAFREHCFGDTGADRAAYFDVLGALGVIRGTGGPGGPCLPEADVTRIEFAAMVGRLLALDPAFKPPAPTVAATIQFTDAEDIPSWAAESVSTCVALGVISGIPDGRGVAFQPYRSIMGAEAAAMLLRVVDNASSITYGWPAGYIYRAGETGLFSSDVTTSDWRFIPPLTPVTREQMAYLLRNALYCQRGYAPGPGGEGTYARPSIGSLLTSYATVTGTDLDMRSLTGIDGRTYRLAGLVVGTRVQDESDLIGRRFLLLKDSQGRIVYLRPSAAGTTVSGIVAAVTLRTDGPGVESLRFTDGRVVTCQPGAVVELNGWRWPFPVDILLPTATATAVLESGRAVYVSIVQEDLPEVVLSSITFNLSAPETGGEMLLRLPFESGGLRVAVDAKTDIYLNGQVARFTDLRELDICYLATEGDSPKRALRVYAYRNRVQGNVDEIHRRYTGEGSQWEAEVGLTDGSQQTVVCAPTSDAHISVDLRGRALAFYLNREGKAVYFGAPFPDPGQFRVVKTVGLTETSGGTLLTVQWRGQPLTFRLATEGGPPPMGVLKQIAVGRDGSVQQVSDIRPALHTATVVSVDAAGDRLTLTSDLGTWTLNIAQVPLYFTDPESGLGPYVDLSAVSPGQPAWLDDPGAPRYILVGPQ